ncbi:MAG: hypothetical protein IPK79_07225 [Vampirovibrionales bacterium]|nr:hypothetical protein [Vampirovibrionales bacterium]
MTLLMVPPSGIVRVARFGHNDAEPETTTARTTSARKACSPPEPVEAGWFQRAVVQPVIRLAQTLLRFVKNGFAALSSQFGGGVEHSMSSWNDRFNVRMRHVDETLARMERESRVLAAAQKLHVPLLNSYHPPVLLQKDDLTAIIADELAPRLETASGDLSSQGPPFRERVMQGVSDALRAIAEKEAYDPVAEAPEAITVSPQAPSGNVGLYARRRALQLLNEDNPHLIERYLQRVVKPMYEVQISLPGVSADARKGYDRAYKELCAFYLDGDPSPQT